MMRYEQPESQTGMRQNHGNLTEHAPTVSDNNYLLNEGPFVADYKFKLILASLCLAVFLSALEFTSISTALPTIVAELGGAEFVWVGSAYALASSAIIPMTGGISQIFGRRPAMLFSIGSFALGSTICGAAQSLSMLIAGRTIQGIGGGAILTVANIILADMVPLQQRGTYGSIISLTWCMAAAIGSLVGGALAQVGQWRWLFFINLPLCTVPMIVGAVYLKLPNPPGSIAKKLARMDWLGNFLVISSTCAITIALTQGGGELPWSSARVFMPLIIGIIGLVGFMIYEATFASYPLVPIHILTNRTSFSGYLQTFLLPITSVAAVYYIPVYFQACKDASPIMAGVLSLGLASISLFSVIAGISVKVLQIYRPQTWLAWIMQMIGTGLLIAIDIHSPSAKTIGFCVIYGVGAGINYATHYYPIQAPLPITTNAHALAFHAFMRSFAGVWGVTLGGAILQNELRHRLPQDFLAQFKDGVALVYPIIPQVKHLPQPLKMKVVEAFLGSLREIWVALTVVSAAGFLVSLLMRAYPLHKATDMAWDPKANGDDERLVAISPRPAPRLTIESMSDEQITFAINTTAEQEHPLTQFWPSENPYQRNSDL